MAYLTREKSSNWCNYDIIYNNSYFTYFANFKKRQNIFRLRIQLQISNFFSHCYYYYVEPVAVRLYKS